MLRICISPLEGRVNTSSSVQKQTPQFSIIVSNGRHPCEIFKAEDNKKLLFLSWADGFRGFIKWWLHDFARGFVAFSLQIAYPEIHAAKVISSNSL